MRWKEFPLAEITDINGLFFQNKSPFFRRALPRSAWVGPLGRVNAEVLAEIGDGENPRATVPRGLPLAICALLRFCPGAGDETIARSKP